MRDFALGNALFISMLAPMLLDAVFFPVFLGCAYVLGIGALRLFPGDRVTEPLYLPFVVAFLTLGSVALGVNFFTGVDSLVYYEIMGAIGLGGILQFRKTDWQRLWPLLPFSLLLVPLAAQMPAGADAGLYHIPHQVLIRDEKIIFGLANLHSRYGFSSMMEYVLAPLWIGEQFKLLSYAHAAFVAAWLLFLWEWISSSQKTIAALGWLTLISMLCYCMYFDFGYTSTDTPSGIMFAIAFLNGVALLLGEGPVSRRQLLVFFLCAVFAYTCKLSNITVVLWAGFVVAKLLHQRRIAWKPLMQAAALPTLLMSMWLMKNFIVSGCLLYPSAGTCLDVSWAAKANAIENANGITAWARHPQDDLRPLHSWNWLWEWWWPNQRVFLVFMAATFTAVASGYWVFCKTEKHHRRDVMLPALVITLLGLALWFFKAPTPRFGIGVFIIVVPVVVVTLFGFRWTAHTWLLKLRLVVLLLLAARLGMMANTHVIRHLNLNTDIDMMPAPMVEVKLDKNFGFRPAGNTPGADCICWTVHYCAPDARPPISEAHGYKFFKQPL